MKNQIIFIIIIILWSCNSLIEKLSPLEGDFYIQDGWLAFSSENYEVADKHFNTAIESNDSGSVFHFLSLIGLGWSNIYKAQKNGETSSNGFVKIAGENLSAANDILLNLSIEEITSKLIEDFDIGKSNLYAALTIQRSYFAKQKAVNGIAWETYNLTLSDTLRTLYEEGIEFSNQIESDFIFQYDENINFNNILIIRTENYLILGNIEAAILSFDQINYGQLNFTIKEECKQGVNGDNIINCLCLVSNNGNCPIG